MRAGVLVETQGFESLAFFGSDGSMNWEHRAKNSGGRPQGEWFVVLAGNKPVRQVLIESATGTRRIAASGSPYMVGAVAASTAGPALFVTLRGEPSEIVAVQP